MLLLSALASPRIHITNFHGQKQGATSSDTPTCITFDLQASLKTACSSSIICGMQVLVAVCPCWFLKTGRLWCGEQGMTTATVVNLRILEHEPHRRHMSNNCTLSPQTSTLPLQPPPLVIRAAGGF